jgi:hypothetical protein
MPINLFHDDSVTLLKGLLARLMHLFLSQDAPCAPNFYAL